MEPIFTLPYSEYEVANELSKHFKKIKGYSILLPLSRQQKGFDLVLYNSKTKKSLRIQIKSSRTYPGNEPKRKTKKEKFKYYTWFNKFYVKKGISDYYVLFDLYSKDIKKGIKLDHSRERKKWYSFIILALKEKEIIDLFRGIKDSKFGFGFNSSDRIILTRGMKKQINLTKYLLFNKINNMKNNLA